VERQRVRRQEGACEASGASRSILLAPEKRGCVDTARRTRERGGVSQLQREASRRAGGPRQRKDKTSRIDRLASLTQGKIIAAAEENRTRGDPAGRQITATNNQATPPSTPCVENYRRRRHRKKGRGKNQTRENRRNLRKKERGKEQKGTTKPFHFLLRRGPLTGKKKKGEGKHPVKSRKRTLATSGAAK